MRVRVKVAIALFIILLCIGGWFSSPTINAQQGINMAHRPSQLIDERARDMRVEDEASVRAVADEIFNYPHVLGRMPMLLEDEVKNRLVRSEIGFLRGTRSGVQEEDIVTLFDIMAKRFKLPDYARTSKKQVRALRMSLALGSPIFMGRGLAGTNLKIGDSISSEMSLLQAAHLAAVLLDQKFLDLNFQVPPDQWDREPHDKEIERIKEREKMFKSARGGEYQIIMRSNPKRVELHETISKNAASMSLSDFQDVLETALKTLKVDWHLLCYCCRSNSLLL